MSEKRYPIRVLAIIPARGGSKGVPGKNLRPLLGRPLIGYSIDAAKRTASIKRIIVTTDSEAIAAYARTEGADVILEAIEALRALPRFRVLPSMRFEHFLTLLKNAQVIVGNSSAGVREAPVYGVPTINIGTRQTNRYHYASIIDVPDDAAAIRAALARLPKRVKPSLHFGRGDSARLFVEQLRRPELWATRRQKQFRSMDMVPREPCRSE
jgi:UDP-N-acetylglucosamine 2-epimerase